MRKQKLVYLLLVLKISWLDASEAYFIIDSPSYQLGSLTWLDASLRARCLHILQIT